MHLVLIINLTTIKSEQYTSIAHCTLTCNTFISSCCNFEPSISLVIFSCSSSISLDGVTPIVELLAVAVVSFSPAVTTNPDSVSLLPAFAPCNGPTTTRWGTVTRPRVPRFLSFSRMSINCCENLRTREQGHFIKWVQAVCVRHPSILSAWWPTTLKIYRKFRHTTLQRICGDRRPNSGQAGHHPL